ncbi:MAG: AAA family ATPase, partial [Candidatus Odinarchaeia archaeon]
MKSIFVTSWSGYSGKTAFCLGLAQVYKEQGFKVGYFRPIGRPTFIPSKGLVDQDVLLMKEVLGLPFEIKELVPILIEPDYLTLFMNKNIDETKKTILKQYSKISADCDIMIVEGSLAPEVMSTFNLNNLNLAQLFNSKILMVTGGLEDNTVDQIIFYRDIAQKEGVE